MRIFGGASYGMNGLKINRDFVEKKVTLVDSSGVTLTGIPYEYDSVGLIIFNTMIKRNMKW
jgi:hypothetical protein